MEIPGRKLYFQQLLDNIWRLPVGRSLQRAEQPHLLHRASIIPAIARREFKFQTMVLLELNSYYGGGLCHHTQTTCALVKSARVSGCRSVPALPTIGLSGIKHVNNYWKNCHNIWDAQGSQRGKPIFNDVTIPLQALPISMRERFLVWWQLLNCICCDPVYGRFGSDLSVSVRVTRQHFFLTLHQFKGRILSAKQVERRWVWRLK